MTTEVNCAEDGYYYRCDVCDTIFGRVVTPSEAKAAKMQVPHVIAIAGTYVKYNDSADVTAAVAKLSNDEAADYSESEVAAANEFAPKYQKALCKTCGDALDGFAQNKFKKAVSTTAADYVSPVGTWTYKNVTVAC